MSKKIIAMGILWLSLQGVYAQISFEKGYFINNSGNKIECLIRNEDWKNNPEKFEYKLTTDGEVFSQTLYNTKEFSIDNGSKYIKTEVPINRSSDKTSELDSYREVEYMNETLFLKVLVDGTANLYYYEDGNLRRFFFNKNGSEIKQLEYKKYLSPYEGYREGIKQSGQNIRENNGFRQQLFNNLDCEALNESRIKKIPYKMDFLKRFFNDYNKCVNPNYVAVNVNTAKFSVNTKLRVGIGSTSYKIESNDFSFRTTDFGSNTGFRGGLEIEAILPFYNKKWAFVVEPTYQKFKKTVSWEERYNYNTLVNNYSKEIDYSSIETPLGIRYFLFFNEKSKMFLSSAVILDFTFNSEVIYMSNRTTYDDIGFNSGFAFGVGYDFNNMVNFELKYFSSREILSNSAEIGSNSKYGGFSIMLGYKIF